MSNIFELAEFFPVTSAQAAPAAGPMIALRPGETIEQAAERADKIKQLIAQRAAKHPA